MVKRWLCVVALTGCVASETLDETIQASTAATPQNPLDAKLGKQGMADLRTSQLVRLPASHFLDATVTVKNGHRFVVKTTCTAPEPERRDTGLIVTKSRFRTGVGWEVVDARYNDDELKNASCPTCSYVDMGATTGSEQYSYRVFAFSNRRTKAMCQVLYSTSTNQELFNGKLKPAGWPSNQPVDLGGALVEIGAMDRTTDWLEVKTPNNGGGIGSRDDARMLLFDVGGTQISDGQTVRLKYPPVLALDQGTDRDPRIAPPGTTPITANSFCTNPCPEPRHFVLVGLERIPPTTVPTGAAADTVETTVSLVRGPEDTAKGMADRSAPIIVSPGKSDQCSTALPLGHGRYTAAIRATTLAAYGEDAGLRGDTSWMIANWGYDPNGAVELRVPTADEKAYYYRGTPNFHAFTMRVQTRVNDVSAWSTVTTRQVPNGAFGCWDKDCFQSLLDDFELFVSAQVRLCVDNADARIVFEGSWSAHRTPASAELKVATFNTHHGKQAWYDVSAGIENDAESRNIANLLATRGRFRTDARAVVETQDDAPFEWNSDVVMLQENSWISSYESFMAQARQQTDLAWRYVWGYGKRDTQIAPNYSAYNAVFSHRLLTPSTLLPPSTIDCAAENNGTAPSAFGQAQCYNESDIDAGGPDYKTYVVPAQIAVRRWGDGDVPILAVSVMMQPGGGNPKIPSRRQELASMIRNLQRYVTDHPEVLGATSSDPRDPHIRIVLAGDFNMYPHAIGENRWFVRELRKVFGYAVDTAAAHRDSYDGFFDMHSWHGVPNGAWPHSPDGDNGMPIGFTSAGDWNYFDDTTTWWWGTSMSWPHYFPYWARTYRGDTSDHDHDAGHERNDGIFLVGKGWASDDAVRGYTVMNTTAEFDEYNDATNSEPHGSPFAIRDALGRVVAVDLSPWGDGEQIDNVNLGARHYRPQFDLTNDWSDGCTANGCAAAESDHLPVGVRLRVTK